MPKTLLLVPGLLCDQAAWAHQVAALSSRFDVEVADLRHFDSITAMAQAILNSAQERISVAGHSMGARVALEMVRIAPKRVQRLALLNTSVHALRPGEVERRQQLVDLADRHGMLALANEWLPVMVRAGAFEAMPLLRTSLLDMVCRMSPDIHRRQIRALIERPDARSVLPGIACPLLVGVGRDDAWSPPAQHEEIVSAVPHARYVIFENSGHMAPMEAPEAVTDALLQWLEEPVFRRSARG